MDIQDIEKRSLAPAKWENLFMAFVGIAAAILSNASALMLDGLFSGVNFLTAVFAAKVAVSVHTKGGLMYEASIGGQKFTFKPKKYNQSSRIRAHSKEKTLDIAHAPKATI